LSVPSLELSEIIGAMIRRWWIVLLVPAIALAGLIYRERTLPFQATLRASVVIPGDTEIPGSAEKPELMVMDDAPGLVMSRVFADAVAAKIGAGVTAGQVQADLSSSRYSRLLSITATDGDANKAKTIAGAAGDVLPAMINQYLVADPAKPAAVQIIDPVSEPTRSRANVKLLIAAETCVALVAGAFLAVVIDLASARARRQAPTG
jgi:capsular polysaccharide biosynthesis protein